MITYSATKGSLNYTQNDESIVIELHSFVGNVELGKSYKHVKMLVNGSCVVNSDIDITRSDKSDIIQISSNLDLSWSRSTLLGNHSLTIKSISSSSVYLQDVSVMCPNISGNNININHSCLFLDHSLTNYSNEDSIALNSYGHITVTDSCILGKGDIKSFTKLPRNVISSYGVAIQTPYLIIDNSDIYLNIYKYDESLTALRSYHDLSITNCIMGKLEIDESSNTNNSSYSCIDISAIVRDGSNLDLPKPFTYIVLKNDDGSFKGIIDRRKLYNYLPARKANAYDKYKHSTYFTNVDLHRHIDQHTDNYDDAISKDVVDKIMNLSWSGKDIDQTAIPNEIIDLIQQDKYVYDGHSHDSYPLTKDDIDAIMNGKYIFDSESHLYTQNYQVMISSLNSYRTTMVPLYGEHKQYLEENELP